ncbi:MAG TPA: glycosyltransferase, partial [Thermoplasmata archaeon]|nr:glycosyltransferase [Thermoplasmata archaeon]
DIIFIMDGDQQYEPDEIPKFIEKIKEGWDVVSGFRAHRADKKYRNLISSIYNWLLIKRKFKLDVKDQNSGFKAFKKEVVKNLGFEPAGYLGLHRFILPLAKIKGYSITEIPISHYPRTSGKSYIKSYTVPFITLRDYLKFVKEHKREIKEARKKSTQNLYVRKMER